MQTALCLSYFYFFFTPFYPFLPLFTPFYSFLLLFYSFFILIAPLFNLTLAFAFFELNIWLRFAVNAPYVSAYKGLHRTQQSEGRPGQFSKYLKPRRGSCRYVCNYDTIISYFPHN
jgi:hypothetical protein